MPIIHWSKNYINLHLLRGLCHIRVFLVKYKLNHLYIKENRKTYYSNSVADYNVKKVQKV